MVKGRLKPGDVIDGFVIEAIAHNGGMARIWQVSRPDIDCPILMKVPEDKKVGYFIVTVIAGVVMYFIISAIVGAISMSFVAASVGMAGLAGMGAGY